MPFLNVDSNPCLEKGRQFRLALLQYSVSIGENGINEVTSSFCMGIVLTDTRRIRHQLRISFVSTKKGRTKDLKDLSPLISSLEVSLSDATTG